MILLKEIVKDNEKLKEFKRLGKIAKEQASSFLTKRGLDEANYFVLKIKSFTRGKDWVAMYSGHTIMSGRPIFWINFDYFVEAEKQEPDINLIWIFVDNIIHEWWHAIMDYLRVMKYWRNHSVKTKVFITPGQEEEDMAEEFIHWVSGSGVTDKKDEDEFKLAIAEFNAFWSEDDKA